VDEAALVFSLINQSDLGKSILVNAYGKIPPGSVEDRLTAASHSLLARGYASISEKGAVALNSDIELAFYPLVRFNNILQITINTNQEAGPEIINVYLGKQNSFTALRIQMGVIYELTHGKMSIIGEVVMKWLDLPEKVLFSEEIANENYSIRMAEFAELNSKTLQQGIDALQKAGFSKAIADMLAKDIRNDQKRGSVVLTNMNSENYQNKGIDEAGAGFLYIIGQNSNWIFSFSKADDQTIACLIPGKPSNVMNKISSLMVDYC